MGPSIFAQRPLDESDHRRSPPKSRLKTLSAFLSNPFTSNAASSPSPPTRGRQSLLLPSAPIPYQGSKGDISLSTLSISGGSPFQVLVRNDAAPGFSYSALPSGIPIHSGLTTHSQTGQDRSFHPSDSGRGPMAEAAFSGLPTSHFPLAELHRSSATASTTGKTNSKPLWKEMPTLASAINIADHSRSLAEQDTAAAMDSRSKVNTMPRSSSSGTIFESQKQKGSFFRPRSASRSSVKAPPGQPGQPEEAQGEQPQPQPRPRRMSRRLSFDSFRHSFAASTSKPSKAVSDDQAKSARAATEDQTSVGTAPVAAKEMPKPHRLTLPPMRSLRTKFSVNGKNGHLASVVKADATKKRIHEYESMSLGKASGGAASMSTGLEEGFMPSSLGRASGGAVNGRDSVVRNSIIPLSNSGSSDTTQSTKPPTTALPLIPSADSRPSYVRPLPPLPPLPQTSKVEAKEIPPTHPSPPVVRPNPSLATPMRPLQNLPKVNPSKQTLVLSPAQDDKSILDPVRSPPPFAVPPTRQEVSPSKNPMPSLAQLFVLQQSSKADPGHIPTRSSSLSIDPTDGTAAVVATRKQSLTEIKDAFSRMRDFSGLDVSSTGGDSGASSRRVSDQSVPTREDDVYRPDDVEVGGQQYDDRTLRRKRNVRPSLDLGKVDTGLQAVIDQTISKASPTCAAEQDVTTVAGEPGDISRSSSTSSGMVTAQSSMTGPCEDTAVISDPMVVGDIEDGFMTRAQSGKTFYTAKDDSHSCMTTRPSALTLTHSRSKSTHDLRSLASGMNLVEEVEKRQGEGWWSIGRPKRPNPLKDLDQSPQRPRQTQSPRRSLPRRDVESPSRRSTHTVEGDDMRLALLERLARSSTLPQRSRLLDPPSPPPFPSEMDTPSRVSRRRLVESERRIRPASSLDFRPRSSLDGAAARAAEDRKVRHQPSTCSVEDWRSSSAAARVNHAAASPHNSGRQRSTQSAPRSAVAIGSARDANLLSVVDDTPTKQGKGPVKGQFINSKISPEIARRASFIMTKSGAAQAQPESKAEHVSEPKRVQSMESERVEGLLEEIRVVKEKHALELDAILGSLGRSKSESKELKEEVDRLTESLHQVERERDEYRSLVGELETRIKDLEAVKPRRRSDSIASTLLPELLVPNVPLVFDASPFDQTNLLSPDEFGKINRPAMRDMSMVSSLHRRNARMMEISTSGQELDPEEENDEWSFKLNSEDAAHLDDL